MRRPCLILLLIVRVTFVPLVAVGAYDPEVGFALGIYGPITQISQDDLAAAVLFDLDFRKHREPDLRERLGPPIVELPEGLHPDLKFKVQIGASNGEKTTGVATTLDWLYGQNGTQKVVGIVGGYYSTITLPIASNSEVFETPQISWGSTSRVLTDKTTYPWFMRTVAPDNFQGEAVWAWMLETGVQSVVFFYRSLDTYGEGLFQATFDHASANGQGSRVSGYGVGLVDDNDVDKTEMIKVLEEKIKPLGTKFIVVTFASGEMGTLAMWAMEQQKMLYDTYQTLGPDSLGLVDNHDYKPSKGYPQGCMKFTPLTAGGEQYDSFINSWKSMTPEDVYSQEARQRYMIDHFRVPLDSASTDKLNASDFTDRPPRFWGNFIFDAAYSFAIAINNLLHSGLKPDEVYGRALLNELRNETFSFDGVTGRVAFDKNGDRIGDWELWNVLEEGGDWKSAAVWSASAPIDDSFEFHENTKLIWVTGDRSNTAPNELTACAKGQRLDSTTGLCIYCRENEFGVDVNDEATCQSCGLGSVSDKPQGAVSCSKCSPGSFRDSFLVNCTLCAAGTNASNPGQSACEACPAGQYSDSQGASVCHVCGSAERTTLERVTDSLGQQTLRLKLGADSADFCVCRPGYRQNGLGGCVECKEGMICHGDNETTIASGYYADVMSPTGELSVYECFGDSARCAGGLPGQTCTSGRKGLTCSECKDGKTPKSDGSCVDCQGSDLGPFIAVLAVGLLCLICAYHLIDTQNRATQSHALLLAACAGGQLVTLMQQLSVVGKLNVNWVNPIESIVKTMKLVALDLEVLRINCVGNVNPLQRFSIKITAIFMTIALMLMIHAAFVSIRYKCQWRKRMPSLVASVGMLFLVFNISVTSAVLEPFQCEQHPNGKWTVKPFPSILCWDDDEDHTQMVVGGAVAFVCVPVAFLAACYTVVKQFPQRVRASDSEFLRAFSFLFFRFRASRHWYAFYQVLRSFGVALILLIPDSTLQAFVLATILLLGFSCTMYLWPWRVDYANIIDCLFGGGSILFTCLACLFMENDQKHLKATAWLAASLVGLLLVCTPIAVVYGLYWRYCRPRKPFQFFLCHHKNGSGAFVRLLKIHLQESSQLRSDVFVDSDNLENLDRLFDHVGNDTENLAVICTELVFTRPWCVGEMCVARLKKVCVLVVTLPGHVLPDDSSIAHLLDHIAEMDILTESGMSEEIVFQTLRWVPKNPIINLPNAVTPQIMDMTATKLFARQSSEITEASASPSKVKGMETARCNSETPQNVMVFDQTNMEATATAWILRKLLTSLLTHDARKLPRPVEDIATLQQVHGQAVILILCTHGIFENEALMQFFLRISTVFLTLSWLPLMCDQSFTVIQAKSFHKCSAASRMNAKEVAAVSCVVTALFKEIAVHFLAQHSSLDVLDVAAKSVAKRLLSMKTSSLGASGSLNLPGSPSTSLPVAATASSSLNLPGSTTSKGFETPPSNKAKDQRILEFPDPVKETSEGGFDIEMYL